MMLQGDARHLPLADHSVHLVITSPPFDHPDFDSFLRDAASELARVLIPTGLLIIELPRDRHVTWQTPRTLRVYDLSAFGRTGPTNCYVPFLESKLVPLISRYSRPGDTVLDPMAGIGTVPTIAAMLGRTGIGIELFSHRMQRVA